MNNINDTMNGLDGVFGHSNLLLSMSNNFESVVRVFMQITIALIAIMTMTASGMCTLLQLTQPNF